MVLEQDASSVGTLIPLLESEPANVPQGMPSVFRLRKNAPVCVMPELRVPILPVMFGNPGAFHAPALPSPPSTQARKGARLFENSIGLNGFSSGPRPFRNWARSGDGSAGAWGRDEIRNIVGELNRNSVVQILDSTSDTSGAITSTSVSGSYRLAGQPGASSGLRIDASRSVQTGPVNVPPHIWQPIIIYLGRPR